eukprot:scaffold10723_cov164-Amphora_coffeaeformis.AAC.3
MEWQTWLQPRPLLLRAITVQGIPVEDQPRIDIYDARQPQQYVYSSHAHHQHGHHHPTHEDEDDAEWGNPYNNQRQQQQQQQHEESVADNDNDDDGTMVMMMSGDDKDPLSVEENLSALTSGTQTALPATTATTVPQHDRSHRSAARGGRGQHVMRRIESPWVDDEGFYKVNQWVAGDFCILCRFGGMDTSLHDINNNTGVNDDEDDTTKLLFRYANATTVLPSGPLECPVSAVDIMPRYQPFLDPHDFLLTLVFEPSPWNMTPHYSLREGGGPTSWAPPPLVFGPAALEQGCMMITQYHALQPTEHDLQSAPAALAHECPTNILGLLWQLSGGEWTVVSDRWHGLVQRYQAQAALLQARALKGNHHHHHHHSPSGAQKEQTRAILDVLDNIDDIPDEDETATEERSMAATLPKTTITSPNDVVEEGEKLPAKTESDESPITPTKESSPQSATGRPYPSHRLGGHLPWRSSIMQANAGDISVALGLRGHAYDWVHKLQQADPLPSPTEFPRVPMLPLRQSDRLPPLAPLDDPANRAAVDLFLQLQHAGVTLEDLQELATHKMYDIPERPSPPVAEAKTVEEQGNPNEARYHEEEKKADGTDDNAVPTKESDALIETATEEGEKDESVPSDNPPPIKTDPRFAKYWKMKSVGLPEGAIKQAMVKDGVDVSIWDLDWEKNYEEQTAPPPPASSGPPMKDDPRFQKYFKMKNVGLPEGAIKNAMMKENVEESVWDLDWDKNYEEQIATAGGAASHGPPMKEDSRFQKYWKMKNVGLPKGAIKNAMMKDGVDESVFDLDWDKNYEAQTATTGEAAEADGPPMKDDSKFAKYWKMKTVGLPEGAIRNAMTKDGLDPSLLDLDWEKSLASQQGGSAADTGPPLKDDPDYQKYFRMLSMGLPPGAVKNAMSRDGNDPDIIDLDPNRSLASQVKTSKKAQKRGSIVPQKRVRRKKIFWKPLDPNQIKENSLWSLVKGKVSMSHLNYDVKEFEDLFTESAEPSDKKKIKKAKSSAAVAKKAVQVIDGKRSMNGGIILIRLRMDYGKIADLVDEMEQDKLDTTQLLALKEFLPTQEERAGLELYMGKAKTEEETAKAYADLSDCEKYMWTMIRVKNAASKFDCMIFKSQFRTRVDELLASIRVIEQACDEVKSSEKLQKVFAMILTLVNTINTGGEEKGVAQGFSLEALLKLNEAKAFDKKTSVLQYLVKLVRRNDEGLLNFHKELKHVSEAQNLMMDMLAGDIKKLSEDLESIREPVTKAAESAEANGERKFRLEDLKEQKTLLRTNGTVLQFNKVDHLTGRTPMERFFLRAYNEINGLVALSNDVKTKYESLLEFFGENREMPSNDFFGTMNKFIKEFMVSEVQVEKEEKARQKEKRRIDAKAKVTAAKLKAAGKKGETSTNENDAKLLDLSATEKGSTHSHPLAVMLASRQQTTDDPPISKTKDSSSSHPLAAMLAARNQTPEGTDGAEKEDKEGSSSSSAPPLASMIAARKQTPEGKSESKEQSSSSSAHPLAAMLAACNQTPHGEARNSEPSSAAHPLAVMLAAQHNKPAVAEVAEKSEEQSGSSSVISPPVPVFLAQEEVIQNETAEESSSPIKDHSAVSHPLAAMLAARNNKPQDPPEGSINSNASVNTVDEAAALVEEESRKVAETIHGSGSAKPNAQNVPDVVQAGSSCDPPAPHVSDDNSAERAAEQETEVAQKNTPSGITWLAEVMKATGRQDQASRPFHRQRSDDTDPPSGYNVQRPMRRGSRDSGDR